MITRDVACDACDRIGTREHPAFWSLPPGWTMRTGPGGVQWYSCSERCRKINRKKAKMALDTPPSGG